MPLQAPCLRFVQMLADAAPHHPEVLAEAPQVALSSISGVNNVI